MLDYANPSLKELFTIPGFNLIHLSKYSDNWLKETGVFQVLLKLGGQGTKEVLGWIESHPDYIAKLLASPYKYGGVSYLLELEKRKNHLAIIENLVNLFPIFKDDIMSAAQQLRQEGILTKAKEVAKTMLSSGYKADEIARLTGLPISNIHKIS
jgi:hypothetical protein